jgi:GntR family transcriptional repressor for pyruvate dehydrogenase complex
VPRQCTDGSDGALPRTPIRRTLSDDLISGVLQMIRDGGLHPGDRLPGVQELSQRFGVAPPTLREALRQLQATGVVAIRHGSGVFVGDKADRRILANPHAVAPDPVTVRQLLETRLLLEPAAAALAATRATAPGLARTQQALGGALDVLDDEVALTDTNMHFHVAVAELSGNAILAQTVQALISSYKVEQQEILVIYEDRNRDYRQHAGILEAIRTGDTARAREAMQDHLSEVSEIVLQRLEALR